MKKNPNNRLESQCSAETEVCCHIVSRDGKKSKVLELVSNEKMSVYECDLKDIAPNLHLDDQ